MNSKRTFLHQQLQTILGGGYSEADFNELALEVAAFQYAFNPLYQQFCDLLGKDVSKIQHFSQIPFLPIQFFKNYTIKTESPDDRWVETAVFSSSGTTQTTTSQHFIRDVSAYLATAQQGFERVYGDISGFCVLALLPSYLERSGSSLIAMTQDFIEKSNHPNSGFFLYEMDNLIQILKDLQQKRQKTLLIGVSFALLDLVEMLENQGKMGIFSGFDELIVMETGGMKGRRRELTRTELHAILTNGLGVPFIHSEYGMTELQSQAYARAGNRFEPMPTLRGVSRMVNDPLTILPNSGKLGVLNIIDLANIDSISFIATDDLCRIYEDGSFEILGRLDNADLRGCNLLVAEG